MDHPVEKKSMPLNFKCVFTNNFFSLKFAFQISGIMGAKKTSDLIPLCHPLPLSSVDVTLKLDEEAAAVEGWFIRFILQSPILFERPKYI